MNAQQFALDNIGNGKDVTDDISRAEGYNVNEVHISGDEFDGAIAGSKMIISCAADNSNLHWEIWNGDNFVTCS